MPAKKPTTCPDCGQKLSEPQRPCGYLGGAPVWCATCESADREQRAAAHRPPKGSHGPRQKMTARVDPEAIRRIEIARKIAGQSLGDYLSAHGLALP